MAIDPYIARGVQAPQIESPINMMAQMYQLRGAQQGDQLNALKIQEARQTMGDQNKLRQFLSGADLQAPDTRTNLLRYGAPGAAYAKQLQEQDTAGVNAQKAKYELGKAALDQSRALLSNVRTPEDYIAWHMGNHQDPILGPLLAERGITADKSMPQIQQMLSQPGGLQQAIMQSAMGAEKFAESLAPKVVGGAMVQMSPDGKVRELYRAPEKADKPSWGNPVDEIDASGKPIRVMYDNSGNRRVVEGARPAPKAGGNVTVGPDGEITVTGKAIPASVLKQATESREALRAAESMQVTLQQARDLITAGAGGKPLGVGPIDRASAAVRNITGAGNINSQGLLKLKQMREKLRGDYLLLAKGVQTEGDAKRAMDAMMPDTNDPQALLNQIEQLTAAQQRMKAIHDESLATVEQEYGKTLRQSPSPVTAQPADADRQALEWANANPGDPRAAAIKQSLGVP